MRVKVKVRKERKITDIQRGEWQERDQAVSKGPTEVEVDLRRENHLQRRIAIRDKLPEMNMILSTFLRYQTTEILINQVQEASTQILILSIFVLTYSSKAINSLSK